MGRTKDLIDHTNGFYDALQQAMMCEEPKPKEKPAGVFSASGVHALLAEGTGKTRQSYIFDVAMDAIGKKKDFDNDSMKHGRNTERNGYQRILLYYPTAKLVSTESIRINDNLWASPDVIVDGVMPIDIKCPQILGFYSAMNGNINKAYNCQLQTQMLALEADASALFYYLEKPEQWGAEDWKNYDFEDENDNHFFIKCDKDADLQLQILRAVEQAVPERDQMIEILLNAETIDFKCLTNKIKNGFAFQTLKSAPRILRVLSEDVFWFDDEVYFWK